MPTNVFGETLETTGRYVRHPAAASGWIVDNKPIDAGSAHILDSNCSHLSYESLRHWVADLGPGTIAYQGRGYDGLRDIAEPDSTFSVSGVHAISWDRRTAVRYGPFHLITDQSLGDLPGLGHRNVRVRVDANGGANSSLTLFAALTPRAEPPLNGCLTFASKVLTSSGRQAADIDLVPANTLPRSPYHRLPCRRDGARGLTDVQAAWAHLWVGWYSTHGSDAVVGISAWEYR